MNLIILAVLLVTKELIDASSSGFGRRIARLLTVPIISLLVLFVLTVAVSITEILA